MIAEIENTKVTPKLPTIRIISMITNIVIFKTILEIILLPLQFFLLVRFNEKILLGNLLLFWDNW